MRYLSLTTLEDSYQAHFLRKALEDEGIRCIVVNENMSNLFPLAGPLGNQIQIQVVEADFDVARNVLNKLKVNTDTIRCPHCESLNIKYGLGNANRLKRIFFLVMATIFSIPIAKVHFVYYCLDCNTEFRKSKL